MQRYSLFLTPSADDFTWIAELIRELSLDQGTPPFEPHVTLHTGDLDDLEMLRAQVAAAVSGITPFSLTVKGIVWGGSYFRSLFVEFEESPLLRRIHRRIREGVGSDYLLQPHLSLVYGEMPPIEGESMAREIRLERGEIRFEQLKIMTPGNRREGWRDPFHWQTLSRFRLGSLGQERAIKGVLFDFGGVLAEEGFREGLHDLARGQGLDPEQVYRAALGAIYACGYITGQGSEADFWRSMRDLTSLSGEVDLLGGEILRRFILRPRVLDEVRRLRRQGITTAILSDHTDWLVRLQRRDRFSGLFERVFNSFQLGRGKRDPALFREVSALLGIDPGELLFIDDTPDNLERARSEGLATLLCSGQEQLLRDLGRLFPPEEGG